MMIAAGYIAVNKNDYLDGSIYHLSLQLDFHKLDEIGNNGIRGLTVYCVNKKIYQQNVTSRLN